MNKMLLALCLLSSIGMAAHATDRQGAASLVGQPLNEFGGVGDYGPCGGCGEPGPGPNQDLLALGTDPDRNGHRRRAIVLADLDRRVVLGAVDIQDPEFAVSMNCHNATQPAGTLVAMGDRGTEVDSLILSKVRQAWSVSRQGQFKPVDPKTVSCLGAVDP